MSKTRYLVFFHQIALIIHFTKNGLRKFVGLISGFWKNDQWKMNSEK